MNRTDYSGFKSGPSRDRSFIKFLNKSSRTVDITWLNYEGVGVKYRTLAPDEGVDVNTFVGHYWAFHDNATGDELMANNQIVFNPPLFQLIEGRYSPSSRVMCTIHIPVYALQERCFQVIRWHIPKDRVKFLKIPRLLQIDLMEYFSKFSTSLAYCQQENSIVPNPLFRRSTSFGSSSSISSLTVHSGPSASSGPNNSSATTRNSEPERKRLRSDVTQPTGIESEDSDD